MAKHANISFKFVSQSDDALIRMKFDETNERFVTWSYTGTDCK